MTFAENLKKLGSIAHLSGLELVDACGQVVATIENMSGKAGSLAVYAHLAQRHGCINVAAANEGLALFAEHAEDARDHPGSHPNIDRLLEVLLKQLKLEVRLIEKPEN